VTTLVIALAPVCTATGRHAVEPVLKYQLVPPSVVHALSVYSANVYVPYVYVVGTKLVAPMTRFMYALAMKAPFASTICTHDDVYDGDATALVSNVAVAVEHVVDGAYVYVLIPVRDLSVASYCATLLTVPAVVLADEKHVCLRFVSVAAYNVVHALSV